MDFSTQVDKILYNLDQKLADAYSRDDIRKAFGDSGGEKWYSINKCLKQQITL